MNSFATILAQPTQPTTQGKVDPGPWGILSSPMFPVILGIMVLYMFMMKSKKGDERKRKDLLSQLKKGDEIQTIGGIIGKVVHIAAPTGEGKSATMDDRITIKSDESRLVVERGRIAKVLTSAEPAATPAAANK